MGASGRRYERECLHKQYFLFSLARCFLALNSFQELSFDRYLRYHASDYQLI